MWHGRVVERADDVNQRVRVLVGHHVDERLRAAALPGRREIGELDGRRNPLFRVVHRGQPIEPGIGHLRDPDRHVALPVRGAAGLLGARHQLKQGGFAAGPEADEGRSEHENPRIVPLLSGTPARAGTW
jgi:hypothetical protein